MRLGRVSTFVLALATAAGGATYYVSPSGNDSNSGLDPASAWRSVAKVNTTSFAPGTQILFERGGEWRESLVASSSGGFGQPIIYDAYGTGPKPRFWGSNVIDRSAFTLVPGRSSTYALPTTPVHSLFLDHQFARSAALVTASNDPAVNIAFVDSNPNTWYHDSQRLYVNTGRNPATDSRLYTAAVRDAVIYTNEKDHLVFRNLVVDETARHNGGYGFFIHSSDHVLIESSEAYRAGKHHFGVINSTGFVGRNLYASHAMPDQGHGGASHYVSFSDALRSGDTSTWIDSVAENANGPYPGFITHGAGLGDVLIRNMTVRGGTGMAIYTEGANQRVRIEGGQVENGNVAVGSNVVIDGVTVTGRYGSITISGNDSTVQNSIVTGRYADWWAGHPAAIHDVGLNNTIRFNTIALQSVGGGKGAGIAVDNPNSNSHIYGNILTDPHAIVLYSGTGINSHDNYFAPDALFGLFQNSSIVFHTLSQWQQLGYDLNSVSGLLREGDANLDGMIGSQDYALIDQGFVSGNLVGFRNGDFNFSGGPPDADDYFLIDRAFGEQWFAQAPAQAISALPEPASMLALAAAGCLALRPRRSICE